MTRTARAGGVTAFVNKRACARDFIHTDHTALSLRLRLLYVAQVAHDYQISEISEREKREAPHDH